MIKTLNLGIRKLSKFNCITSTAAITNYHKLSNLKQNYYLITINNKRSAGLIFSCRVSEGWSVFLPFPSSKDGCIPWLMAPPSIFEVSNVAPFCPLFHHHISFSDHGQRRFSAFKNMCDYKVEKAMAPHSSTLAWKTSWAEEPGRLQSTGSRRVRHDWATSLSLSTFMHWRRKWQPTPVFLPGESQEWGSLVGCRLWGRTASDMTEAT